MASSRANCEGQVSPQPSRSEKKGVKPHRRGGVSRDAKAMGSRSGRDKGKLKTGTPKLGGTYPGKEPKEEGCGGAAEAWGSRMGESNHFKHSKGKKPNPSRVKRGTERAIRGKRGVQGPSRTKKGRKKKTSHPARKAQKPNREAGNELRGWGRKKSDLGDRVKLNPGDSKPSRVHSADSRGWEKKKVEEIAQNLPRDKENAGRKGN